MILVDTSAWIEYDRATGSAPDTVLTRLITERAELAVTEPVLMEVLAGARHEAAAARLRRMLTSFLWVPADPHADFEAAARVYRSCRQHGITTRGLVDCMIAAIAMRSDSTLLAADGDYSRIAGVVPLDVHPL